MTNRANYSVIIALLLTGALTSLFWRNDSVKISTVYASPYMNVDVNTAYDMIVNGSFPELVILDVRTQSEYESGHIYRALWIPSEELESRIGELAGHEDHEIIVYCRSGGRSATSSGILDSHDFTKVFNMLGGILAWESAGYPIVRAWDITGQVQWIPDRKCDIRDIALVSLYFGSVEGDDTYDARVDITGSTYLVEDGKIDIRDISLVALHFGETY